LWDVKGVNILWTIGSQMAVRLSALCASSTSLPGRFLLLISVRGSVDCRATVRQEGLGQLEIPMTSSWIEPATFQLVATACSRHILMQSLKYIRVHCVYGNRHYKQVFKIYYDTSSITSQHNLPFITLVSGTASLNTPRPRFAAKPLTDVRKVMFNSHSTPATT
jgi:hypothetical protein